MLQPVSKPNVIARSNVSVVKFVNAQGESKSPRPAGGLEGGSGVHIARLFINVLSFQEPCGLCPLNASDRHCFLIWYSNCLRWGPVWP